MQVHAIMKNVRMSAQKMREVTRQIQGMPALQAQAVLAAVPRKGARLVAKTLKSAIAKAGLPPPAPPMLTPEQTQNVATLKGLHGAAFDKAYVAQQIQAHQRALGVMQAYASGGDNPVIRKAAADTAPIVQHHLAMAQALH